VSHRPADDWLLGLPLYTSSALMVMATALAVRFFRRQRAAPVPAGTPVVAP
jgi:hypothetical protein